MDVLHTLPSHTAAPREQTRCRRSTEGHFFLPKTDGRQSQSVLRYQNTEALRAPSDPKRTWSHAEIPLGTFSSWRWSPNLRGLLYCAANFAISPPPPAERRRLADKPEPSAGGHLWHRCQRRVSRLSQPDLRAVGPRPRAGFPPPRRAVNPRRACEQRTGSRRARQRGMPAGSAVRSPARAAPPEPFPEGRGTPLRDSPRSRAAAGSAPPAPLPPPGSLAPSLPRPPRRRRSLPPGTARPSPGRRHPLPRALPPLALALSLTPPGSPLSAPRGPRRPGIGTDAAHAPPTRDLTAETAAAETETTAETAARGHEPAGGAHPPAALGRRRRRSSAHCLGQRRERPPFPRRLTALGGSAPHTRRGKSR